MIGAVLPSALTSFFSTFGVNLTTFDFFSVLWLDSAFAFLRAISKSFFCCSNNDIFLLNASLSCLIVS